jgi:hypothetical protein
MLSPLSGGSISYEKRVLFGLAKKKSLIFVIKISIPI